MLQYKGDHNTLGYWYDWIKYKDRFEKMDERQRVRCGESMPILWTSRVGGPLLGFLNTKTEEAFFSQNGKAERVIGKPLSEMEIIVRVLKGGPAGCACDNCPKAPPAVLIMRNEWNDLRVDDPWPAYGTVMAGGRVLNAVSGEPAEQMVALWYVHGEPVMGRIWNKDGKVDFSFLFCINILFLKVAAAFGWGGKAFQTNIGSIQVLTQLPDHVRGFDYHWRTFKEASIFDKNKKEYHPVHVDSVKGWLGVEKFLYKCRFVFVVRRHRALHCQAPEREGDARQGGHSQ